MCSTPARGQLVWRQVSSGRSLELPTRNLESESLVYKDLEVIDGALLMKPEPLLARRANTFVGNLLWLQD